MRLTLWLNQVVLEVVEEEVVGKVAEGLRALQDKAETGLPELGILPAVDVETLRQKANK